jgi:hypothetical protein
MTGSRAGAKKAKGTGLPGENRDADNAKDPPLQRLSNPLGTDAPACAGRLKRPSISWSLLFAADAELIAGANGFAAREHDFQ